MSQMTHVVYITPSFTLVQTWTLSATGCRHSLLEENIHIEEVWRSCELAVAMECAKCVPTKGSSIAVSTGTPSRGAHMTLDTKVDAEVRQRSKLAYLGSFSSWYILNCLYLFQ